MMSIAYRHHVDKLSVTADNMYCIHTIDTIATTHVATETLSELPNKKGRLASTKKKAKTSRAATRTCWQCPGRTKPQRRAEAQSRKERHLAQSTGALQTYVRTDVLLHRCLILRTYISGGPQPPRRCRWAIDMRSIGYRHDVDRL